MIPMLNVFKIQQHFNTPPQMAQQQYVYLMSKNFDFEIQFVKITCIHPVCIHACVCARARVCVCVYSSLLFWKVDGMTAVSELKNNKQFLEFILLVILSWTSFIFIIDHLRYF